MPTLVFVSKFQTFLTLFYLSTLSTLFSLKVLEEIVKKKRYVICLPFSFTGLQESIQLKYCIYHQGVRNNNDRLTKKKCLVLKVQCHFSPVKPASRTVTSSSQTTPTGDCFSFLYAEN